MGWMRTAIALLALAAVVAAGEFSARITTDLGGKSKSYPIYVKGKSYCMLQEDGGEKLSIVVDMERNVTTVIVDSQKAYLEIPTDGLQSKANDPIQAVLHIPKELVFRDAGKETLGKYECEKREYSLNDKVYQIVWFSTELGLPLRIEQKQGGGRTFTMTEIKPGPVDAALFAVPEGYKKMDGPPQREPKPTPEEKPKPAIQGTAYGRAPWGGRLAQGAEARIHFDQMSDQAVQIHNESNQDKAHATVTWFLHGKRVGTAQRIELMARAQKEVEKKFTIEANEARVTIDEGTCFVMARQNEKMGSDRHVLNYLRAPLERTIMLKPNQHTRIVVLGDFKDDSVSTVKVKLVTPEGAMDYDVPLRNGESWRRLVDMSEKVSSLEVHVLNGAVTLAVVQGARAKPLPPYAPEDKRASSNVVGAINYDDVEWMKQAMANGLPADFQVGRNQPMIKLVAAKASPEMLSLLLGQGGVNVEEVEKGGTSLLGAAANNPRYWRENMELLLSKGADVNFKNRFGFTPLHYAVGYCGGGKPEVLGSAQLLLEKGADVNAPLAKGDTPLHKAVDGNDVALVELLVKYGANVTAQGRKGRTPVSRAEEIGNKEIIEALKQAPAKE